MATTRIEVTETREFAAAHAAVSPLMVKRGKSEARAIEDSSGLPARLTIRADGSGYDLSVAYAGLTFTESATVTEAAGRTTVSMTATIEGSDGAFRSFVGSPVSAEAASREELSDFLDTVGPRLARRAHAPDRRDVGDGGRGL